MCIPPAAMAIISAGISAAGVFQQSQTQSAIAKHNAKVADINANTERETGRLEADRIEDRFQRLRATARVNAAKSGINPAVGSAAFVIDQEGFAEQRADQLAAIWNRDTRAVGFENTAIGERGRASAIRSGGIVNAFSTFLGGLRGGPAGTNPFKIA